MYERDAHSRGNQTKQADQHKDTIKTTDSTISMNGMRPAETTRPNERTRSLIPTSSTGPTRSMNGMYLAENAKGIKPTST